MAKLLLVLVIVVVYVVGYSGAAAGHEAQVAAGRDFGRNNMQQRKSPGQAEFQPSAYREWVAFHITYNPRKSSDESIVIKNSNLAWGKWYGYPDKDNEVSAPDGTVVKNGEIVIIAACGRDSSPTGTEGSFELWQGDSKKIASVNFNVPFNPFSDNSMSVTKSAQGFFFDYNVAPLSGPIGDIYLTVFEM